MANVDFFSAFEYAWGENGAIDTWVDTQYKLGWASIGSVPPSVEQFNAVHHIADLKANWLFGQLKTVADDLGIALAAGDLEGLKKVLAAATVRAATFAEVDALAADQGPIIVTDMGGMLWTWVSTAYFTGYRNPLCATIPQHFAATARAWEMPVTGGVWSESDPKQRRLIAWFREQGLTVASGSWAKGWGRIADLGGGDWKAPDLQDVFLRMAGTDADTANPRPPGAYQAARGGKLTFTGVQTVTVTGQASGIPALDYFSVVGTNSFQVNDWGSGGTTETVPVDLRPAGTATLPVILI